MTIRIIRSYRVEFFGTAANDQSFQTKSYLIDDTNDLVALFHNALGLAFQQITKGKAIYGKPGVGCAGPYNIHRVVIEQVRHDAAKD